MTIIGRVAQPSCIAGLWAEGSNKIGAISVVVVTAVYATAYGRDQRITVLSAPQTRILALEKLKSILQVYYIIHLIHL